MKTIFTFLMSAMLCISYAQSILIADYPFTSDGLDAITGAEANLQNAPFAEGGVYSNGIYPGADGNGTTITTAEIEDLDLEDFGFTLEFRAEALPTMTNWMPIVSGGPSWRWLTVMITDEGFLGLRANNGAVQEISEQLVEVDVWHDLELYYDGDSMSVKLNDVQVIKMGLPDLEGNNNKRLTNSDWGAGRTFQGYWRNLKVYNGGVPVGTWEVLNNPGIQIFPNPATGMVQVSGLEHGVRYTMYLFSAEGRLLKSYLTQGNTAQIDLSGLSPGIYFLQAYSSKAHQTIRIMVE